MDCACHRPLAGNAPGLAGDRILFWPPMAHTARKIRRVAERCGLTESPSATSSCVVIALQEPVDAERLLVQLSQSLTDEELDATQALVGTDRSPTVEEIPFVRSLRRLLAALEHRWFELVLQHGRLTCAFQPIVSATDRTVVGHEALLRAVMPDGEVHSAARLLAGARALGQLVPLDVQARIVALEEMQRHRLPGLLFINFTPTAVYDPATCLQTTWRAAERLGIDPSRVVFEVIETESLPNLRHVHEVLLEYRRHGFRVALDDLGAGYSSLNWLSALQPDFIKIDRGIAQGLAANPVQRVIAEKLVEISHSIGARVIAEGIEAEEDARTAAAIGIDYLQGYLFGRPQILANAPAHPG